MKYFVVSDIHSFAKELKESLKRAGFDKRNKEHTLIVIGDLFDRGNETLEVYNFLKSIPKKRCILIRGNHEDLYLELLNKRGGPDLYDYSNHTVDTFCHIAGVKLSDLERDIISWDEVVSRVRDSEVTEWLQSPQWVDYYEVGRFIFTHSFIPTTIVDMDGSMTSIPNWREDASRRDFAESRWGCPWKLFKLGLFKSEAANGKTLVCGHWHTPDFRRHLTLDDSWNTDIFYSEHLIGIDGGVYIIDGEYYHPQNVLVIEDGICYNENGYALVDEMKVYHIETVEKDEDDDDE